MKIVLHRLLPFFLFLAFLFPLLFVDKGEIVLFINQLRTPFWDMFFIKSSALGNAWTVALVVFLVLRFKLKWLAVFLLAFAIQVVVVLLLKKGIYAGELRPYLYFKELGIMDAIQFVEGVKIRYVNSFPSGHTATIFFLVSFFALLSRNQTASWVLMILGLIVGFSRIYLVQHFFADVFFGMLFGTLSSVIAYLVVRSYPKKWHAKQIKIDVQHLQQSTQNVLKQLFND